MIDDTTRLLLRVSGLSDLDIDRLVRLREQCQRGEYNEETQDSKRLMFARWLNEHGKLTDY